MFKSISKKLTRNYRKVPLFFATFDLNKYEKEGAKGSCELNIHPSINDEYVVNKLNELVDYIRDNYDMEDLSK